MPREEVPDDRGEQCGEDDGNAVVLRLHRLSDGVRDRGPDQEEGEEVPAGRPHNRDLGLEDVRRDHGGDGVRRIVESVREVEQRRKRDDADHCKCCEVHSIQSDSRWMPDGLSGRLVRNSSECVHPTVTPSGEMSESRRTGFPGSGQTARVWTVRPVRVGLNVGALVVPVCACHLPGERGRRHRRQALALGAGANTLTDKH